MTKISEHEERCITLIRNQIKNNWPGFRNNGQSFSCIHQGGYLRDYIGHACYSDISNCPKFFYEGDGVKVENEGPGILAFFNLLHQVTADFPIRQLVEDLHSCESPLYKNLIAKNPPLNVKVGTKTFEVNSVDFASKYGFIVYNTEETDIICALIYGSYIRYHREKPMCIRNYYALRDAGMSIRPALLLGHTSANILTHQVMFRCSVFTQVGHNAYDARSRDFKYDMYNDFTADHPPMIENGYYQTSRSNKIIGYRPADPVDNRFNDIYNSRSGYEKFFAAALADMCPEEYSVYGGIQKDMASSFATRRKAPTAFSTIGIDKEAETLPLPKGSLLEEGNEGVFIFHREKIIPFLLRVIKEEFGDAEKTSDAVSSKQSRNTKVA